MGDPQVNLGRPWKYRHFLVLLQDEPLYCPATIADLLVELNCRDVDGEPDPGLFRRRLRIAMARFAKKRGFPKHGDGMVDYDAQAPIVGWFGWRWKQAAGVLDERQKHNRKHSQCSAME